MGEVDGVAVVEEDGVGLLFDVSFEIVVLDLFPLILFFHYSEVVCDGQDRRMFHSQEVQFTYVTVA